MTLMHKYKLNYFRSYAVQKEITGILSVFFIFVLNVTYRPLCSVENWLKAQAADFYDEGTGKMVPC